ncbi:MAG TPA: WG repeat-containing protein [Candidatus Didemnitutus sp.]|nr:WG repeat-containing protein [Candidatus Didemnitutus sp.]
MSTRSQWLLGVALFLTLIGLAFLLPMHMDRLHDDVMAIVESQKRDRIKSRVGLTRIPVCVNDRWGYVDERGQLVIQHRFRSAGEFADGLAAVRDTGLFGYINEMGDWVLEPQWDVAMSFSEGLATVYSNDRAEVIDSSGRTIFTGPYNNMSPFEGGMSIVETDSGDGVVTSEGREIVRPGHKFYIIDSCRILLSETKSDDYDNPAYHSWRLIDRSGISIRSFEGVRAVDSKYGVPLVVLYYGKNHDEVFAQIIDRTGRTRDVLTREETEIIQYGKARHPVAEFIGTDRRATLRSLRTVFRSYDWEMYLESEFLRSLKRIPGEDVVVSNDTGIVTAREEYSEPSFLRFFRSNGVALVQVDTMWVDSLVSIVRDHIIVTIHDTMCVVSSHGAIVWRGKDRASSTTERDIAYRGDSFGAIVSRGDEDLQPKSIDRSTMSRLSADTRADGLDSVHVISEYTDRNSQLLVSIVNRRSDTIHLIWSSRGVQLDLEARRSPLHEWVRVEKGIYLCGQDGFPLPIPPGQFIRMKGTAYQGARIYETRLAFIVSRNSASWRRKAKMCYSPVFTSRLNPAQFYRSAYR